MEKIKTLFMRNMETDRRVRNEITPGAEWVQAGEGIATRKFDGSATRLGEDGRYWKRYDRKEGRNAPDEWEPAELEPDPISKHWPGWLPVGDGPEDRWFRLALSNYKLEFAVIDPGTYEAIGPHFNGNPEKAPVDTLVPHGIEIIEPCVGRDFDSLREFLQRGEIEGIVWHHPDGRMVKLKAKDFGFKRV